MNLTEALGREKPRDLVRVGGGSADTSEDGVLTRVLDALPDGMLLLDQSWHIVYANQMARQLSRIRPENLNQETLWELYPEILGTDLEQAYREVMQVSEERHIDAFYYQPFQTWFDIRIMPMAGGMAVHYRDVTSTKEAEAARDAAKERLQQVLEATTDSVVSIDRSWRITYMNQRAREIVAPSGEVLGTNVWESFPAALYEGSPFLEKYHQAMNEGIAAEFEAYYPQPLNFWVRVLARPSRDGIIVFFRDVTQEKLAAAALIQSEKLAAVGRLASSIAHEINNPLEAVTNLLYLASQYTQAPQAQQCLEAAEQELRRVSNIANQTLRFHRQATRPRPVDCTDLYAPVLSMYEAKLRNSDISIEKRKCAHERVLCFEGEIRQVLSNLVGNAIDAMPNGGRLIIRSREGTDWKTGRAGLVLTVADNGSGIDPEAKPRIFEAFFTTKGMGGTGLGLWISAEIVARHQGRICIRSSQRDQRRGTVVTLFLPFQTTPQQASSFAASSLASA